MKRMLTILTSFLAALTFSGTLYADDLKLPGTDSGVVDTLKSAPKKGLDEVYEKGSDTMKGMKPDMGHDLSVPTPGMSHGSSTGGATGAGGGAGH